MKNEKNLTLSQERLVRLQDDQAQAAIGGADGNGSTPITVDVLKAADEGGSTSAALAAEGSCCSKSCQTAK